MQLVWFRQDLRLVDHPALHQACQRAQASGETVEAVFFITPAQWQRHHMAAIRQRFLLERLNVLGQQLAALGMVLHVLEEPWFAGIPARLQQLVVQRMHCRPSNGTNVSAMVRCRGCWRRPWPCRC